MRDERQRITARREGASVHPRGRVVEKLATYSVEWQALTPRARLRPRVDALDEAAEHARMPVCATGGDEDRVWVPRDRGDCATDGLLEMLGHPPVVLLLEVADSDGAGAATDCEFGLRGGPAHAGCRAVYAEEDKGRLPTLGRLLPDVGVAVCGGSEVISDGGCWTRVFRVTCLGSR